jgi:hypothetical protein
MFHQALSPAIRGHVQALIRIGGKQGRVRRLFAAIQRVAGLGVYWCRHKAGVVRTAAAVFVRGSTTTTLPCRCAWTASRRVGGAS